MEESSMTNLKNETTLSYNLKKGIKVYKLEIIQSNEKLMMTCTEIDSIPQKKYLAEFSKASLNKISKFFLMFENIKEAMPEIISKISKNEIDININENTFQLIVKLNIMNCKDINFNLYQKENNINSIVESLCEAVKALKEENQNLKKEIEFIKGAKFFRDNILINFEEMKLILDWINPKAKIKLTILYQMSQDGDSISNLYSQISNKSPTLILLKTSAGFRCGGYTTVTWENTGKYKKDNLAFLFSLKKKKKYQISSQNEKYAIFGAKDSICFGYGPDLSIFDKFITI